MTDPLTPLSTTSAQPNDTDESRGSDRHKSVLNLLDTPLPCAIDRPPPPPAQCPLDRPLPCAVDRSRPCSRTSRKLTAGPVKSRQPKSKKSKASRSKRRAPVVSKGAGGTQPRKSQHKSQHKKTATAKRSRHSVNRRKSISKRCTFLAGILIVLAVLCIVLLIGAAISFMVSSRKHN